MSDDQLEIRLSGLPISEGVALGEVCLFRERRHDDLVEVRIRAEQVDAEHQRLDTAIGLAAEQLDRLVPVVAERVGAIEAEIFSAQKMILLDPVLLEEMHQLIDKKSINSEAAVARVFDDCEARILALDSEHLRERSTDVGEVKHRLLDALRNRTPSLVCAGGSHCLRGRDRLILAAELTPSLTVELDTERTLGFVTERGGPTSHAAILARAMGVPAVSGVDAIEGLIPCGTTILVNGTTGEVVVRPSAATVVEHTPSLIRHRPPVAPVEAVAGLEVMANISLAEEVGDALAHRAEGIGLYRTEYELLAADRLLGEDEQLERYASVVRAMAGRPVCIRLFDLGADNTASFLGLPREPNPALGLRGARLLLARPELTRIQARAIARAAALGPVDVLYPMIVDRGQFLALRRLFLDSVADLPEVQIRHGVMFELPAACVDAEAILQEAEHGSIGSNDLLQFLFAVDRGNELVAAECDPDRPAFWHMIQLLVEAARKTGRPPSVCGEAACDLGILKKLVDAGLSRISVSPRLTALVRHGAPAEAGRPAHEPASRR